jgi:DNA polymerase elongation subunit (family B)
VYVCFYQTGPDVDCDAKSRSSPKRDRSSSPMDMETSSEEEEDGQISKFEEEEEKEKKLYGKQSPEDDKITLEDLQKVQLTRDMLAKHCMAPWFEDYVKGMCFKLSNVVCDFYPSQVPGYDILLVKTRMSLYTAFAKSRVSMIYISCFCVAKACVRPCS